MDIQLEHYLDGAGCIYLFPPKRDYHSSASKSRSRIEQRMKAEGITVEEAFQRESDDTTRAFRQVYIGQIAMTVVVLLCMLVTGLLVMHHYSAWIAVVPHFLGMGAFFAAQIRYRRRVAAGKAL